ncbi:hypothetical protein BDD43_5439 [Mucilaginibacter gracilis]|uniref:Outer membrane receptor protein involved in Fe transport n=1 Tax=Mucilaginibacter gracilis TaxID=423350 RepID=A0A495J9L7_9SPHI|nr:hypothetical protein [Mucilaginibacter gracilis]RKR85178.1 hypothetical protein BDD43_5439 [Mucilaginibacter gracilis]
MRWLVIFLIWFPASVRVCIAQVTPVNLAIVSEAGDGITDCNVKIMGNNSGLIYSYFSMGNTWVIKRQITPVRKDDSLLVSISHISYRDTTVRIVVGKASKINHVVLKLKFNILKDIKIKGPPVWKQGDTTSFRADAFTQGDEKKLKDIIRNLPGFSITETGELRYHNVAITRILIDGDELFADKIKLLLNSFPSRVINLLQVRQNQSNNKLLKGGSETVLNLTLKKGTFRAAFGDFDVGIGDKGRYQANPVLFSLNRSFKLGYIGNLNSLGQGLGWQELQEVKSLNETDADGLLISGTPIHLITNMPEKYYLKNRLLDNRFEANTRISSKLNIKSSVSIISDRQPQETYDSNNYFNGYTYQNRLEHWQSASRPFLINIGQTYNYDINAASNLLVKAWWFADYGRSVTNTTYLTGDTSSSIGNQTKTNRNSFNIIARYTHINQQKRATTTTIQYNWQQLNQNSGTFSLQWPQIFQLSNPGYNALYQKEAHRYSSLAVDHSRYFKIGKLNFSESLSFKRKEMWLEPTLSLSDSSGTLPAIAPEVFNLKGNYVRNSLSLITDGKFVISTDKQTLRAKELSYHLDLGLSDTHYEELILRQAVFQPQISIRVEFKPELIKKLNDMISLSYDAAPPQFTGINTLFLPQSATTYRRSAFTGETAKTFAINYNSSLLWKDDLTTTSFFAYYLHNFNNYVTISGYSDYLNKTTDSLANKSVNSMTFGVSNTIPSLLLNAVIVLEGQINYYPNLFFYQNALLKSINTQMALKLSIKKNWNKKYFIILSSNYNYTGNYRPALDNTLSYNSRLDNFTLGLKQRAVISKSISAIIETQQAYNDFRSPGGANFLLLDTELNCKLKRTPLTITLKGENLTDRRSYIVAYNYVASQSVSTIPLIGRNFFVALRLEL